MKNTGNMKTIAEIQTIIDDKYTYIPLLQRNYKWSRECAAELAEDLWDAFRDNKNYYQLNMITIFNDKEHDSLQILDGQQRMITLKLLLAILDFTKPHLNYAFERDYMIDERRGRRYFLNHVLKEVFNVTDIVTLSVDTLRLWENYNAMIVPASFRSVYAFYNECIDSENRIGRKEKAETLFITDFNRKVINVSIERCFGNSCDVLLQNELKELRFEEKEIKEIYELCSEFQKNFTNIDLDEDISDDELRMSELSDKFQSLWLSKLYKCHEDGNYFSIIKKYDKASELVTFILEHVEMLYHETISEPIDEFLNINENKTRFVISDYIRAKMISDNPIDGVDLTCEQKQQNQAKREQVLDIFASISNYLYADEYETMWNLVKTRYDDFEKNPDINRLKIIFCDKYFGTSTKGYVFEEELDRLIYINSILNSLQAELGLGVNATQVVWNTYNAVYMLLECKKKYRFFNIFTKEDIEKNIALNDVTVREKFCFFEAAYRKAKNSEDIWDISYFLESQLYEGECKVKKKNGLPKEIENDWCLVDRGEESDDLQKCLNQLIEKIKTGGEQ